MNKVVLMGVFVFISLFFQSKISIADELSVPSADDSEILVNTFPADGKYLIIWLPPEYGFRKAHTLFSRSLSESGVEVWQADIIESLFMLRGAEPLRSLDGRFIADVIEYAHKTTGKKIILAGDSYGALAALTGAHQLQKRVNTKADLVGAILFSPYTYAYIPSLGMAPEYMPVISSTNIPLMIYQAKGSGAIGQFDSLLELLQKNDNPVYTKYVPEVMSLFYKEEPSKAMLKQAGPLPRNVVKMLSVLDKHKVPDNAVALSSRSKSGSGIDIYLKEFKGNVKPIAIELADVYGNRVVKKDFKDQITLVNFWATWCGPCVEEIPSLNRLKEKMDGLPFELISINYAEDKDKIARFMKQVNVEYPVLLDNDGDFAKQWKVITYPSTFVIGLDGEIKFGVNAAIEWDSPELIQKMESLMKTRKK
ncbi:MAG: hypothetical protein DIZ80_00100 [endosymbiont of Galathealinum brachiosum]|uniref:Thioredoxin domain-containing protein n=1 Tax=endosymbiont of Galathealinum brachiosum TaxID=2200906 RepID=A0A370DM36_9GAMM|nr:MAG: hypothetical protein DIZ80_00100 [endosymbiont of Galathealinum brachiosum]